MNKTLNDLTRNGITLREARHIRDVKKGCTYRALAEYVLSEDEGCYGHQWAGEMICNMALKKLYPEHDIKWMDYPGAKFGDSFDRENLSLFCRDRYRQFILDEAPYGEFYKYELFYWWE